MRRPAIQIGPSYIMPTGDNSRISIIKKNYAERHYSMSFNDFLLHLKRNSAVSIAVAPAILSLIINLIFLNFPIPKCLIQVRYYAVKLIEKKKKKSIYHTQFCKKKNKIYFKL